MIIDSHCHAWATWPYEPAVPDPQSRGRIERLLWEMDQNGVDRAVIICAAIAHNANNSEYVFDVIRKYNNRFVQFADIDCRWSPTHQTRGAADRLRHAADRYGLVGFTFYLEENADPAWILSPDGLAFFAAAAERDQIVSLACGPHQLATIAKLAQRFPAMPFLLHHLARVRADDPAHLPLLLAVARVPNLFVKISGFPHATPRGWDFPCRDVLPIARAIYEHFGPSRMCWGSDYPVIRRALTYRQGIEIVRTHCDFIARDDLPTILGGTLAGLLDSRA